MEFQSRVANQDKLKMERILKTWMLPRALTRPKRKLGMRTPKGHEGKH